MPQWSFLTNHARVLVFIAQHPDARLREIAEAIDVTERTAFGIVADLTAAGYIEKEKAGRRNRYHVQGHLPLVEPVAVERTIGEILDLLVEPGAREWTVSKPSPGSSAATTAAW